MLSAPATFNTSNPPYGVPDASPRQPSPLPKRSDSLLSTNVAKPKPTSILVRSLEDLKFARVVLDSPLAHEGDAHVDDEETRERRHEERQRELTDMLGRMSNWVEELAKLLHQSYKNQTDLETALTLTRSNLQLALANNEMLEEAVKRGGNNDVGWRRWSDREGVRRSTSGRDYGQHDRPGSVAEVPSAQILSGASRFFNFKSPLQRGSPPSNTSPTSSAIYPDPSPNVSPVAGHPDQQTPPDPSFMTSASVPSSRSQTPAPSGPSFSRPPSPPPPSIREQALAAQLAKERAAFQTISKEKAQLEGELESLSQALFEEANTMVSKANRKLAETEEELRIVTDQREALRGALRIVEGENGQLRGHGGGPASRAVSDPTPPAQGNNNNNNNNNPHITVSVPSDPALLNVNVNNRSFWSPETPSPASSYTPSPRSMYTPPVGEPDASSSGGESVLKVGSNRWSMMPSTPDSRVAARNKFEEAMRRMQGLVSEEEKGREDNKKGTLSVSVRTAAAAAAGGYIDPMEQDTEGPLKTPTLDTFDRGRRRFEPERMSEREEVEDELNVGSGEPDPWTA